MKSGKSATFNRRYRLQALNKLNVSTRSYLNYHSAYQSTIAPQFWFHIAIMQTYIPIFIRYTTDRTHHSALIILALARTIIWESKKLSTTFWEEKKKLASFRVEKQNFRTIVMIYHMISYTLKISRNTYVIFASIEFACFQVAHCT